MSKAIQGAAMLAGAAILDTVAVLATGGIALAWQSVFWSLVIGGISMEAGAIADALLQNRAMGITTRQPAAFRQIVYGEQRIGGVMVYESTTGSHLDQYNMIIVLATHEIDSIVNLYLDGRQVFWDTGSSANVNRNGVNFGGSAGGGTKIGPGGQHYNFDGLVYCDVRFGDQAPGDVMPGMTSNDPNWAATDAGSPYLGGCAYVYLKVERDASMFPQFPEIKFTVRGKNNIVDPRQTVTGTAPNVLARPTTLLNGWGNNAHVGAYEEGVDQGYNFGLNDDTTLPYTAPDAASDGSTSSSAFALYRHSHQYAGCVWKFPALGGTAPSALYLNINSAVDALGGNGRSAGIWFSIDNGTSWTQIYNTPTHPQQWDVITLSPTMDTSQLQVMAFIDSHDDMSHYVYDIQLADAAQLNGSNPSGTGFTTNWALIVADVLQDDQWGLGDLGSVNVDQLIAAANVCDEQVSSAGGAESQWALNWHYDTGTGPGDALDTMMLAAAGRLSRIGGEWFIWPAYYQGPTFTFDQSVLTAKVKITPYRKQRELFNRVNGTYIAANFPYNVQGNLYDSNGYYQGGTQNNFPFAFQPTNYPQYAADQLHGYDTDGFLAQDGGIQLPKEVVQNCVLSVSQAQRAAKVILFRNRQQLSVEMEMGLAAWQMQPLDVMLMTLPNGFGTQMLEVATTRFEIVKEGDEGATVKFSVQAQATDPTVYEWDPREELSVYDVPANTQIGSPYSVPPPTSVMAASNSTTALIGADGVVTPRILLSWVDSADSTVVGYNIQYQAQGASSFINAPGAGAADTTTFVSGVVSGTVYVVQIQARRGNGAVSEWVQVTVTASAPSSLTNQYQLVPQFNLSNPDAGHIAMSALQVQFGSAPALANYSARTFSIPGPTVPTWYYVTIADPTQQGETSATLVATCSVSDALVGAAGNTYIGAIQALPAGGGTNVLAGGWPAPQTVIVGD